MARRPHDLGRFGSLRARRHGEQFACPCDLGGAVAIGQQAIVANAVEAARQHVDQETADELVCCQRHHLVPVATFDPVILPPEGDGGLVSCDQAAIRDGDAVGVARQISEYRLGSTERALAVDHPLGLAQRREVCREGLASASGA